ncbi:DegT/DnrJ/EryC1/StrS family aminotransferase [Vibrio tapetis]|uniref:Uncharacterized protein n=1 Tax=Vibrio tapetis subsp. tapetis TaxID=1671868 RepID=A0A2N8ZGH9_9VIBR|nr:DegT/DnrJ/EryC1/StrS family aminotransferase [Vibrio tapetis]SON51012.1 conserved protein of unknown function [Vibrio tapetis subsp. tapetis]
MIPLIKVVMPEKKELLPELESVLYSGQIAEGEAVYKFEDEFNKMFCSTNGISMSSGTSALHASLHFSNVSFGDEVISTSMTAEPTNVAICQVGAKPIFADVYTDTGNLSVESIEKKISPKTKAILVVHYAGYPVEIEKIRLLADKYKLSLIEDCAHALGAEFNEKKIGSFGDFSIFSFQAIKHMTTVDGGFLFFKNKNLLTDIKKFRWFGLEKGVERTKVNLTSVGYKYNMNNVNATIGLVSLNSINSKINMHISNGQFYDTELAKIQGVKPARIVEGAKPSYWLYTLLSDDSDELIKCLTSQGVSASKLHRPNHQHSLFASKDNELTSLELFYNKLVHIPCGWWVADEDRNRIVEIISKG